MESPFDAFIRLYSQEQYDEALRELVTVEKTHCLPPNILVIKAACIQLGSGDGPYALEDATSAFKRALEIDPEYVEALNESGYYWLYVLDRREVARPCFEKAMGIARSQLTEAIVGIAECIAETSACEALEFIEQAVKDTVDREAIDKAISEVRKWL